MQAAAARSSFVSDTTFSSPANVTTIQYVNGSTVLVYSSARLLHAPLQILSIEWTADTEGLHGMTTEP